MTREEADVLATFLNRCNDQYEAEVLPLGLQAWVVLSDHQQGTHPPPIVEVPSYLRRLCGEGKGLSPACVELLFHWLEEQEHDPTELAELMRLTESAGLLPAPSLSYH